MTRLALSLAICCFLFSVQARAQTDARDYEGLSGAPNHTTAVWMYYRRETASNFNTQTAINLALFRATHVLRFGQLSLVPLDFIVPVVDVTAHVSFNPMAPALKASIFETGFGDPVFLPSIAYRIDEGEPEENTHTYMAFTSFITMPIGNYSSKNPINTGENRWVFKPHAMIGQRFLKVVTTELGANVQIFGDNDNFIVPASHLPMQVAQVAPQGLKFTRQQDASFNLEAHLAVDLHSSMYVSTSYYLSKVGNVQTAAASFPFGPGGAPVPFPATTVEEAHTVQTLRFNWGVFLNQHKTTLLLLQVQQDVTSGAGEPLQRYFGVRFSHAFFPSPAASAPQH